MTTTLHIGQRCISEAEPELGLGTITQAEINRLEVVFPALEEPRIYARRNAPLKRFVLFEGDTLHHCDGSEMTVVAVDQIGETLVYLARDADGQEQVVPEMNLADFLPINQPRQRLLTGQLDGNRWFELRVQSLQAKHRVQASGHQGLLGARAMLLGHQLYVATQATTQSQVRVLLSDEVGLGKTIEAGLILQRLLQTDRSKRALILVPESLQHQWLVEMMRRFNIRCRLINEEESALDGERDLMAAIFAAQDQVLDDHSHWIIPIERLVFDDELVAEILEANFDTVIVDEAHRLQWTEGAVSEEYGIVQQLAAQTTHMMLLTATPSQFGMQGHFARLHLLDPERYPSYAQFAEEQSNYAQVADWVKPLVDGEALADDQAAQLVAALGDADAAALIEQSTQDETAREQLLNRVVDRLGTGRALYRNTRQSVGGFCQRELNLVELPAPSDSTDVWWKKDARVDWLIKHLKANPKTRFVLICHTSDTALELLEALRVLSGIPAAVFHEGMSILECDRAAAFFADEEDGAQILICSSIGAEGRNFQFVSDLVLFDMPDTPDALEQRIGRLDRIGQSDTIRIHVPVTANSRDQHLSRWYHQVLNAFEQSCGYGGVLFEELGHELDEALGDEDAMTRFIEASLPRAQALAAEYQQGRDRLLEWQSYHPVVASDIVESIQQFEHKRDPWPWFERAADCYGLEIDELSADRHHVYAGDHAEMASFDGLPEEGATFSTQRETVIAREDVEFLNWEHPLVQNILEDILSSDRGKACLAALSDPALKPGEILIEAFFAPQLPGYSASLAKSLPSALYRVLTTLSGVDITARVPTEWLRQRCKGIKKTMARQLAEGQREAFKQQILAIEQKAEDEQTQFIEKALKRFDQQSTEALNRANALGMTAEKIALLSATQAEERELISGLQFRFEALRLIFTH